MRWCAPELFVDSAGEAGEEFSVRRTPQSDVYAFGCVCLEVSIGVLAA